MENEHIAIGVHIFAEKTEFGFNKKRQFLLKEPKYPKAWKGSSLMKSTLTPVFHKNPIVDNQTVYHKDLQLFLIIQESPRRGPLQKSNAV